ncbi:hypothetical protein [Aureliella helgolandensis]|uniref:Neutral/alkaline non-lysosomal ceramidase n=1 Tax=Aureliella helgolandensis TaxID=2527968 RepID=A0A518G959_9BACT|nr:hypothetical protein [Aureliella helgolandensis]QDV25135.1 hypothetical protein Q31a_34580 [Aureliella helgolandensis]
MRFFLVFLLSCLVMQCNPAQGQTAATTEPTDTVPASSLRIATFDVDATPRLGEIMAYDPVRRIDELGLRCRGIILLGAGEPIVLCAVDWIGIGNGAQDYFRDAIAGSAGTQPERVVVHTLHQHDAPRCDFSAEQYLLAAGVKDVGAFDTSLARDLLHRLDETIQRSIPQASVVTHTGVGVSEVEGVASNRRILGDDGKVRAVRYTTTRDAALRAEPEGIIDPELTTVSFWNEDQPLAVLSYYACHPQSYYRTGVPSPDFPGIARFIRSQDLPDVMHVHFNGAGGNIGAGKYNDGAKENRLILARRLADGMRRAYEATEKFPTNASDLGWETVPVSLPPAEHLNIDELREGLSQWKPAEYWGSPDRLAWLDRCQNGQQINLSCLRIGDTRILHMPGELFVEYQLAAKAMRSDLTVAMAAYGDYGPGYIGTKEAYSQGGYETSPAASNVSPEVEKVLMDGMRTLLGETP